jgi:tetratricopeptide (TPR) repeat protein/two-component sensor histidine kinase
LDFLEKNEKLQKHIHEKSMTSFHSTTLSCITYILISLGLLQTSNAQDYRWSKDSLQRAFYLATVDTVKAKALMDLAGLYAKTNPDTCILLAKEALNISQQAKFKRGEVHATNVIGLAYYRKNDYDNALIYYEKVQKNIEMLALAPRCGLFLNVGNIHLKKSNYSQALITYQKTLKLAELLNNKQAIAICLNNIGTIHEKEKEYALALKIYEQSLKIKEDAKDKKGIAATLNNIGIVHEKQNQFATALIYHQKAIKIYEELKDQQGIAMVMNNIAAVEKKQKKNDAALEKYQKGLQLKENAGDKRGMIYSLNGIAEVLQGQKRYDEGIKNLEKSLAIAKEIEALAEINTIYNLLAENYQEQGKYKQALLYMGLAKQTNDSIFSVEKAKEILKLQTAFDVERKEIVLEKQKIEIQKQDIELQALEKENKIQVIALAGLVVLLLLLGLGGYFFYRNRQLKAQFALLESEQRWRRSQMNPHFFFNALSAIQKFVMQADTLKATSYIAKFAKLMRQVLEQSQDEFTTLAEEIETIRNYIQLQQLRFADKFDYELEISEDLDLENTLIPSMFTQPIIENAIEHGLKPQSEKGLLKINIKPATNSPKGDGKKYFMVEIEDNGVGKQASAEQKNPKHRSFATQIMAERIALLNKQKNMAIRLETVEKPNQAGIIVRILLPL